LRNELEKIKLDLKYLQDTNFKTEDPDKIEQNINTVEKKIKEIETLLEYKF
jgi:K+/H+ antiporter YhaU regulatory subunit KhtT